MDINNQKNQKGSITITILVFSSVFLIFLSGLIWIIIDLLKTSSLKVASAEALEIAEAGVDYCRWHLAHAPDDFQDGTGGLGPYVHDYKDPEGEIIGKFSLEITPPSSCDSAVKVESTGWTLKYPDKKRKVKIRYAKRALAEYSFLTNEDVWFGESEELKGPFHSNGGIRMDGDQNSLSTSAKETYTCQPFHGCSPAEEKSGIWGDGEGGDEGFWKFPVPSIDFGSITQDLSVLKTEAQAAGIYLGDSGEKGYRFVFKNDGTIDVYKVTGLQDIVWGYNGDEWVEESNSIKTENFYQNYSLPLDCAPIFVEDNIWVEGEIGGRITLVAARLPDIPGTNAKMVISDDINYYNPNSVLGLIAQKDILIPLYSPDRLEIRAAMLAQKGHVFRYYYPHWGSEPYNTYAIRDYIETYGSIITNTVWTFSWVDGGGNTVSGYENTEMMYDPSLTFSPPPYFPTHGDYEIISWEEL